MSGCSIVRASPRYFVLRLLCVLRRTRSVVRLLKRARAEYDHSEIKIDTNVMSEPAIAKGSPQEMFCFTAATLGAISMRPTTARNIDTHPI